MTKLSILDFGAQDGGSICTRAIQETIDACFLQGGGVVEIPGGRFLTGGFRLRSNVTLHLQRDACLIGSRNPEDYMGFLQDPIEALGEQEKTDEVWAPVRERKSYDFMKLPGGRWSNGLIRAIDAHNIAIIGEENAVIDGMDCYDGRGEERYRGPHAISFHRCENIRLSGYIVRNSANWAHAMFSCRDIQMSHVTVLAGHDGVHLTTCDHTKITDCHFFTGDDCVAGIDNIDLAVSDSEMNTACSAFRLGGTDILIQRCHMFGPALYLFRGSLSREEKVQSAPSWRRQEVENAYRAAGQETEKTDRISQAPGQKAVGGHRYNMLSAYTYYADFSREIRKQPGNIVLEDCVIENVDRLLHYNFSGNEPWQNNRPLKDIVFRRISASHVKLPLVAYGDRDEKITFEMTDSVVQFREDASIDSFMQACNYEKISLKGVTISNLKQFPCLLTWSEGQILLDGVEADGRNRSDRAEVREEAVTVKKADRPFTCKSI